jgi:metacaspase-1
MKKALCIGIASFENPNIAPLAGCVNDANLMAAVLERHFGFTEAGIRSLTDDSATKARVLEGLDWLVDGASRGDVLVLSIATHVTWIEDGGDNGQTGEGPCSKTRKRVVITRDYSDTTCLLDSEVNEILDRIPEGANCYSLMDICHAGMTIKTFPAGSASPRARYAGCDAKTTTRINRDNADPRPKRSGYGGAMNRIAIVGCADHEQSYDVPTTIGHHGLLTFALCQTLHKHAWNVGVGAAFAEVRSRVRTIAKSLGLVQNPQLHGPQRLMNNKLFR